MKNTNVHRILIPVDFSPAGDCALEHGAYLANVYRADMLLLHIMEGIGTYPHEWFNDDKSKGANKELIQIKVAEKLGQYAEDITKKYGVYVQSIVTTGKPASKIVEAVEAHDINLIVMGTHGSSGFEEFFMGGNAHKVVNLSPCPVITVRAGFKSGGFKSIVLPIDETLHSRQKVSNVLPLATKCKSEVHVLGVVQSSDKTDMAKLKTKISTVQEAVEKAGLVCVCKMVKGNNIAMEAMKYAEDVNAELLSIMTDHESDMTGMFMGTFARQIVNHSKVPVLSIKPETGPYESSA
jgi:nucleotide-binding universal stress UspA family protein